MGVNSLADPAIARRGGGGAPIFGKNFYTPQLALICSRGIRHAPPENCEIWGLQWRISDHISV